MLLADLDQYRVFDQLAHVLSGVVDLVLVAEGRVLRDVDTLLVVELSPRLLLQPRLQIEKFES